MLYIIAIILIIFALSMFIKDGASIMKAIGIVCLGLIAPYILIPVIIIWLISTCKGY